MQMISILFFFQLITFCFSCEEFFEKYEKEYKIPKGILRSIALVESGCCTYSQKRTAWPWSLNSMGVPHTFLNKKEAICGVSDLLKQGKKNIDVGCMQINLKHHPNAFENLDQAFDPEANVRYGAFFLKTLYNRCRNWHLAIARYHSNNMIYSRTYLFKVLKELGQKRIDLNCIPPYIIHIFQKNKQIRPGGHLFTSAPHLIQNCTKNKRHQLRKKAELIAKELISKISCQKMSSSVRVTRRQVLLFSKNLK